MQEKLLDAFENNKTIMNFCKKYDTKIQFRQYRSDKYVVSKMFVAYDIISNVKKTLIEKFKSLFKKPNVIVVDGFSSGAYSESTSVDALVHAMDTRTYLFDNVEKVMAEKIQKDSLKKAESSEINTKYISNKLEWERQIAVNERIRNLIKK